MIDLRSDTLTRPTPAMRAAIAAAEVGDDVFGEDPTVRRLEEQSADLLGKEAALFVPSGTMGNQLGVRVHCNAGDEFLCEAECHILNQEQAASAQFFGVYGRAVSAEGHLLTVGHLEDKIRPDDVHYARTRLVCLENTQNRGGGRILPFGEAEKISAWAAACGLARHLDGARLFNAAVALGGDPRATARAIAAPFDSVSVCFSKGLGAPVGSAIVGSRDLVRRAHRWRKMVGGGMRQSGVVAAAALHALEHHVDRLADDHVLAKRLASGLAGLPGLAVERPQSNIVFADLKSERAPGLLAHLQSRGVLATGLHRLRFVTHLDVDADGVDRALAAMREYLN